MDELDFIKVLGNLSALVSESVWPGGERLEQDILGFRRYLVYEDESKLLWEEEDSYLCWHVIGYDPWGEEDGII